MKFSTIRFYNFSIINVFTCIKHISLSTFEQET